MGGGLVPVEPGPEILHGELDVDGVGPVPPGELGALVGPDDVVGRGDDAVEGHRWAIAQAGERFEVGHGSDVAQK